ncbi:MAG TPA: hypothetical protein VK686_20605 [Bryobacteraceae bacterium]|jgi:hypothetical protein|nr:hypothetical protein [Bryobacteraceae bacterium]
MKAPELEAASIVMLGSFNPAIFQPRWLGVQKLIRTEEAESAKITTIQSELADFSTEWFHLQVLQNRFQITSQDPRQYSPLRDLAAGSFAILPHTPVTALGLNRSFHFEMPSVESWHGIGNLLAPKDLWNPIIEEPGLRSLNIQGRRKDADGGVLHIKVEPSLRVAHGLFVEINEEFKAPSKDESDGARWASERLVEHWDAILRYSEEVAGYLLNLVNK